MSDSESSGSYLGLGDPQWLCMVSLFVASLLTLGLYFAQYFQLGIAGKRRRSAAAEDEDAGSLLGWALSLESWKSQWKAAWCKALNDESSTYSGGPVLLTFEDDGVEASELTISKVSSFQESARNKVTLQRPSDVGTTCSAAAIKEQLRQLLCSTQPSVVLSCRSARASEVQVRPEAHSKVASPPKPPRAHDWKLLVKNIRVSLQQEDQAAGSMNPLCVLQLDDPPQKFNTCVLKDTPSPAWDQPFIFKLNGQSKELNVQVMNDGQPPESSSLGQVCVPFDLVKKQPEGQQTFALMTKDKVTGSLTTEFTYLDPGEVRSWHPPTPASSKRVEMDRTVMPCGTVVTTVTAVKSKPGRPLMKPPDNLIDSKKRRVSEQASMSGVTVSKALSSSDTELLVLNGTDPVAEAAIRQLHQSAKQKLKSPVKKSTIIISGIAKTPLSQDDELALMAGYAAAMDASMSESSSTQDVTMAVASGISSPEASEPQEGPTGIGRPPEDWESQTGEELDHTSLSMCVSEASCKKSRGSFLQKSAKLFFRRRHQRKEPGMSQSHNDLVYLESPAVGERVSRTATLSRVLGRKSKSKANGSAPMWEPQA
uniref:C2 calcium dependent domain containing 2 n=1 Tax=Nothobranchius furzeri TaxID=105023 RepID=A0A8C6NQ82_NOTFU